MGCRGERIGLAGVEVDVGAGGIGGETGTTMDVVGETLSPGGPIPKPWQPSNLVVPKFMTFTAPTTKIFKYQSFILQHYPD